MSEELAWAAGFMDGEGCFSVTRRKNGYVTATIVVSQKDARPLERLQRALGGLGKVVPRSDYPGMFTWRVTSRADWRATVALLRPYLSEPKLEQIATAEPMLLHPRF